MFGQRKKMNKVEGKGGGGGENVYKWNRRTLQLVRTGRTQLSRIREGDLSWSVSV